MRASLFAVLPVRQCPAASLAGGHVSPSTRAVCALRTPSLSFAIYAGFVCRRCRMAKRKFITAGSRRFNSWRFRGNKPSDRYWRLAPSGTSLLSVEHRPALLRSLEVLVQKFDDAAPVILQVRQLRESMAFAAISQVRNIFPETL